MARTKEDFERMARALYAKANAEGVTAAEKKMLEDKADDFVIKHKITLVTENDSDVIIREVFTFKNPYAIQKSMLYNAIAKIYNCKVVRTAGHYKLIGYKSDYQQVEFLFSIIVNQAFRDLAKAEIPIGVHARTYRVSWWYGFINEISSRLEAANVRGGGTATTGSYAIELYDRNKNVDAEVRKDFPSLRKGTRRSYGSNVGYSHGQTSGANAALHNQSTVGNGTRALGRGN